MGFLDKLKQAIIGATEKADDTKDAAARARRTVDDSTETAKRSVDDSAKRAERAVDDSAEKVKRAGNKAENAVDDTKAASDELKKD